MEVLNITEAKLALKTYISLIQQTIADPEIVQGRLLKAEKNQAIHACKTKNEWLESTHNPTMQDFLEQRQQLENIMQLIFTKLNAPRPEPRKTSKP
ncbi:ankyrin repeat domain-containing protein 45-like [Ascaphus truei]|uniref:ankyrin repeat domain-containing protein 45-like n=1 Tax=Ascaphus truei TaxID=8439 RepID=UPI003F5A8F6B